MHNYFNTTYGVNIGHLNPNVNFGHALVALTEAPLYNLQGFASTVYQRDGAVKRMISTGFYNENIWYSILFQIMVALYVLQDNEILFNNFDVNQNIFIKDLSLHSNLTGFWKYKIKGIDYYIPNYGYLALFDTNYGDISGNKISSTHFGDPSGNIKDNIFDNMFKNTFDPTIFNNKTFTENGGIKPPSNIMTLLNTISSDTSSKNILNFIEKYMNKFLNNRVGTQLKETETPNIRKDDTSANFKKGQMVVEEYAANSYNFVLFIENNTNGTCKVFTRGPNKDILEANIASTSLYPYSKPETIEQTFKANEINLNEDDLIETYIVSV